MLDSTLVIRLGDTRAYTMLAIASVPQPLLTWTFDLAKWSVLSLQAVRTYCILLN